MAKCKRKKAFLGAIVPAALGVVSSIINNKNATKQAKENYKLQQEANLKNIANTVKNNILSSNNSIGDALDNTEYTMNDRLTFKCGGKSNKVSYARKYACGGRSKRK